MNDLWSKVNTIFKVNILISPQDMFPFNNLHCTYITQITLKYIIFYKNTRFLNINNLFKMNLFSSCDD
jgi:hypothetical protein